MLGIPTFGRRARGLALILAFAAAAALPARAADPIKIGFSMALTGSLASNGKVALIAMKIWEADINAKGGLLGRPVQLDYYDDQSNPANVPGIYTKLLDVDKVDLVVSPYSTVMTAPAMPVVMAHGKVLISLVSLNINEEFHYPKYFAMIQTGAKPTLVFSKGFFDAAMAQTPKPKTVAIAAADQEFSKNAADGARQNAKAAGLDIVYDKSYPPTTNDFAPIVRAVQATNPDIFFITSYPRDSVGMLRALSEIGYQPKMLGGAMVGLNNVSIKEELGPLLNGVVGYENWLPEPTMDFPGVLDLLKKYQAQTAGQGVDPLGYNTVPPAYAYVQILGEAVAGANSLDPDKLADYLHNHSFETVWGPVKFGPDGEWADPRFMTVQYHDITGKTLDQFDNPAKVTILSPTQFKTGDLIYPYAKATK